MTIEATGTTMPEAIMELTPPVASTPPPRKPTQAEVKGHNLSVALQLAAAGRDVIPVIVSYNSKTGRWDKTPPKGFLNWQKPLNDGGTSSRDADQIRIWWTRYPLAVPGLPCGTNDLVVIDCDRHDGKPDGVAAFAELVKGMDIPPHPKNTTAGNGEHHYFKQPADHKLGGSKGALPCGVDARGVGNFIVAPGSMRSDGVRYTNAGLIKYIEENKLPVIPDCLASILRNELGGAPKPNGATSEQTADGAGAHTYDRPALDEAPLDELAIMLSALVAISADVGRELWIKIIAALHWENWTCSRAIADAWSATSTKFNEADQEKQWRNFDRPRTKAPNTKATVYQIARDDHSWTHPGFIEEDAAIELIRELAAENDWIDLGWINGSDEAQEPPPAGEAPAPKEEAKAETPTTEQPSAEAICAEPKQATPKYEYQHEPPWPVMGEAAYHGLLGELVRTIDPYTESDPVAVLIQALVCFGSTIGRSAHYLVEASKHHTNLFTVLIGDTAKARKGTSWNRVAEFFKDEDHRWYEGRVKSGLSTGEGLIYEVRDQVMKWDEKEQDWTVADPGVEDKRLLINEPEFAKVLAVMSRQGNTLNHVVRDAWDHGDLSTMTRTSPLAAKGAHISINAHITEHEMRARVTETDMANGFLNRFVLMCIKRSKELPFGGDNFDPATVMQLRAKVAQAIEHGKTVGRVLMTPAARELWAEAYHQLTADRGGLAGAIIARAEAHVIRKAILYAVADLGTKIDTVHLKAAMAVWNYSEASSKRVFGESLGDHVADEVLRALRNSGEAGLARTAFHDLFGRNQSASRIGSALQLLLAAGKVRTAMEKTGGRGAPTERWFVTGKGGN